MQCTGTELRRRRGIIVTRQHMVIAITELDREVCRCATFTDLDTADMEDMPQCVVRRDVCEQFLYARAGEDVGNTAAGKAALLLPDKLFHRSPCIVFSRA